MLVCQNQDVFNGNDVEDQQKFNCDAGSPSQDQSNKAIAWSSSYYILPRYLLIILKFDFGSIGYLHYIIQDVLDCSV